MTDFIQAITSSEVTLASGCFKLLLSLVFGSLIGFERRCKGQTAGMRTFALIAMGSTLAMLVSIYIPQEYLGLKNGDPGRIAAQVISGIGFLGAGAIINMKGAVKGLTTAAGIWITACIGLAVGAGMFWIAALATLGCLFVFLLLEYLESWMIKGTENKVVRIKVSGIVEDCAPYRSIFKNYRISVSKEYLRYDYTRNETVINYQVVSVKGTDFAKLFHEIKETGNILSLTLSEEINN